MYILFGSEKLHTMCSKHYTFIIFSFSVSGTSPMDMNTKQKKKK